MTGGIEQSQGVRLIADPEFGDRSVRSVSLRPDGRIIFFSRGGGFSVDDLHHSHGVVVKDGGDIFRRELVRCV